MVGSEDEDDFRVVVSDEVDVLKDCIGRPLEPLWPHAHLGRDYGHEVIPHKGGEDPVLPDMLDEGLGLVLDEEIDGVDAGVDEVAEDEVDNPQPSTEGNGRL